MMYHSLYRTELDLRKMEMGNQRIQLYVAVILLFYNFVLSKQKTKKSFSQKGSESSQGGYWSIKDKGIHRLFVCKHSFSPLILYCSVN